MAAILPAIVCGGGMLVCFILMSRMHGRSSDQTPTAGSADNSEIETLRGEVDRLRVELRARDEEPQPAREFNQN